MLHFLLHVCVVSLSGPDPVLLKDTSDLSDLWWWCNMLPYHLICITVTYLCLHGGWCCVFFCCLQEPTFAFWHPFSALLLLIWNWSNKGSFTVRKMRLNINVFILREAVVQRVQMVDIKRVKSGKWSNTKNIKLLQFRMSRNQDFCKLRWGYCDITRVDSTPHNNRMNIQ